MLRPVRTIGRLAPPNLSRKRSGPITHLRPLVVSPFHLESLTFLLTNVALLRCLPQPYNYSLPNMKHMRDCMIYRTIPLFTEEEDHTSPRSCTAPQRAGADLAQCDLVSVSCRKAAQFIGHHSPSTRFNMSCRTFRYDKVETFNNPHFEANK